MVLGYWWSRGRYCYLTVFMVSYYALLFLNHLLQNLAKVKASHTQVLEEMEKLNEQLKEVYYIVYTMLRSFSLKQLTTGTTAQRGRQKPVGFMSKRTAPQPSRTASVRRGTFLILRKWVQDDEFPFLFWNLDTILDKRDAGKFPYIWQIEA